MTRRVALICNPASAGGRGAKRLPLAQAEFDRLDVDYRTVETTSIEHAREEAEQAVVAGEHVAGLGGDGLLRPLAAAVRGSESSLAIIPGGRGNDFGRVLGIPTDTVEAARVAAAGHERLVDVATVDGEPFLGIASFGFDSDANRLANEAKVVRGNLVYLYAALRALAAWKPARFTVTVDGEELQTSGFSVIVANSKAYGGGMFIAPQAELDDGVLDVVISGESSKLAFLRGMPKVFKGEHLSEPSVSVLKGNEVQVAADRDFEIYADGDPIGFVPATIKVERQVLRVVVPA
jgi:YegS/Rv2252/BmrU family lipid kinase